MGDRSQLMDKIKVENVGMRTFRGMGGRCPKQLQGTPGPQRHWDCVNSSDIVLELSPFPSTDSLMGKLTNVY